MAQLGSRVKPRVDRRRGSCRVRALRSSAGDGALRAADGYFRILGRVDDVISVAGHRLGTKELESASLIVLTAAPARARPAAAEPLGPACHRRAPDSRSRRIRLRWGRLTWSNWRR